MTLGEAREVLAAAVRAVNAEGFDVWTFQDAIVVAYEYDDRTHSAIVLPEDPDWKPEDRPRQ